MAVDLHTRESKLPSQLVPDGDDDVLSEYHKFSDQKISPFDSYEVGSHIASSEEKGNGDKDDDFISEFTREMAHFVIQDDDQFHLSGIGSSDFEMSWDSTDSSQSTLWSPFGSNQGSPEGPSLEPTPPATPCDDGKHSCRRETSDDVVGMFDNNMNIDETGHSKYLHSYGNPSFNQSLIDQQIRAVQQNMKQKLTTSPDQTEFIEPIQQVQEIGKGSRVGSGNARRNRPPPLFMPATGVASGSGLRAGVMCGSGSRTGSSGTGVFLPRVNTATSESRKKTGSSTVLIPARVVQALQLHFDQMAATSGPKASAFPPLREVLVSNKDGMYSLQKRQSRKEEEEGATMQKETRLPQEWTY